MPAKKLSVTVFVPVKNGEHVIKDCIDSLLAQTYSKKKIYVIDNMSTDGTYEILNSYGKKIKFEKVKGWVPKVHNHVLRRVNTDLIAYTDADCVAKKDWLEKLVAGFTSDEIVAVAGYGGTPKSVNKLQRLIGRELESRWKKFPKFISRAPTMNLCVRVELAKKIKFDEKFFWAWETDFGYRLTRLGKMRYLPNAIVQHYHRTSWKSFFRQQMNNSKIQPFLWREHRNKITGDHISTSKMGASLFLAYLTLFFLFLGLFLKVFLPASLLVFALLLFIFISETVKLQKDWSEFPMLMGIFFVRTTAWMIGIPTGILYFIGLMKPHISGYDKKS